jgi:hypothetical protein
MFLNVVIWFLGGWIGLGRVGPSPGRGLVGMFISGSIVPGIFLILTLSHGEIFYSVVLGLILVLVAVMSFARSFD